MLHALGLTLAFSLGTGVCVAGKLYLLMTLLVIAIMFYVLAEYRLRNHNHHNEVFEPEQQQYPTQDGDHDNRGNFGDHGNHGNYGDHNHTQNSLHVPDQSFHIPSEHSKYSLHDSSQHTNCNTLPEKIVKEGYESHTTPHVSQVSNSASSEWNKMAPNEGRSLSQNVQMLPPKHSSQFVPNVQ